MNENYEIYSPMGNSHIQAICSYSRLSHLSANGNLTKFQSYCPGRTKLICTTNICYLYTVCQTQSKPVNVPENKDINSLSR